MVVGRGAEDKGDDQTLSIPLFTPRQTQIRTQNACQWAPIPDAHFAILRRMSRAFGEELGIEGGLRG